MLDTKETEFKNSAWKDIKDINLMKLDLKSELREHVYDSIIELPDGVYELHGRGTDSSLKFFVFSLKP